MQVTNTSVESDFFSSSAVVSFTAGVITASAVLLLQNDAIPEGNETFIVSITGKKLKPSHHVVDGQTSYIQHLNEYLRIVFSHLHRYQIWC